MTNTVTSTTQVTTSDSVYLQQMLDRMLSSDSGSSALRDIGSIGSQFDKFIDAVFDRMDDVDPRAALALLFAVQAAMNEARPGGVVPQPPTPEPAPTPAEPKADLERLTRDLSNILRSATQPVPAWVNDAVTKVIDAAAAGNLTPAEANTLKGLLNDIVKAPPAQQDSLKAVFDAYLDAATPDAAGATTDAAGETRLAVMPPPNRVLAAVMREVLGAVSDGQLDRGELSSIRDMISDVVRAAFGDNAADAFVRRLAQGGIGAPEILPQPIFGNFGPDSLIGPNRGGWSPSIDIGIGFGPSPGLNYGPGGVSGFPVFPSLGGSEGGGFVPRNVLGIDFNSGYVRYLAGMAQATNFAPRDVDMLNTVLQLRGLSTDWLRRTTGSEFTNQFLQALAAMNAPATQDRLTAQNT